MKNCLLFSIVAEDITTAANTYCCLLGSAVAMTASDRVIYAVYVEYAFYVKGNNLLKYGQMSPLVTMGFQLY